MHIEESGGFAIDGAIESTLSYLADPEAVARCLPGEVNRIETHDNGSVTVDLTASAGHAAHDLRVQFAVDEVDVDAGRVCYTGQGLGSRVKVDLFGEFVLEDAGDGIEIKWQGVADVGGLLSSLNRGVAEATVRERLAETADNVRLALDAQVD